VYQYHAQAVVQVHSKVTGLNLFQANLYWLPLPRVHQRLSLFRRLRGLFCFPAVHENFGLCRLAHIANLIQEQRTAACRFKLTYTLFDGRSKGAFFVTEQLAFNQF
jgi:hypothetical protein